MSIAHYVTFIRIFISPIFLLFYLEYENMDISLKTLPYILLFLLGISELSDAVDGYLARKLNQVTDLGKILDPMADSIYRISVFLTFTLPPVNLPMALVFIFIYRDSIISTLRTVCALKGFALAARPSGKLKAVIQAFTALVVILLLIPFSQGTITEQVLQTTCTWVVSVAAIYSLFSGADYIYANWGYIQRLLVPSHSSSREATD